MIGADNGGIDRRDRQRTRSHVLGQVMMMMMMMMGVCRCGCGCGCGIGLIGGSDTGASVCIPPGSPLGVNDLRSESPGGLWWMRRGFSRLRDWRRLSIT